MGRQNRVSPAKLGSAAAGSRGHSGRLGPVRGVLVLLVGTSLSSLACVNYIPVELNAVPPGEEVRVRLTDAGAIRAARQLGRIRNLLEAGVAPQTTDSVAVIVWLGRDYPGTQFASVRETVVLPREEVTDFQLRRLSVPRTVALFAGAAVVFGVLADQIIFQEDRNPDSPGDDERPPPAGFTILRILIGHSP